MTIQIIINLELDKVKPGVKQGDLIIEKIRSINDDLRYFLTSSYPKQELKYLNFIGIDLRWTDSKMWLKQEDFDYIYTKEDL